MHKEKRMADIDFDIEMFSKEKGKALISFIEYIYKSNKDVCLEISDKHNYRKTEN